MTSNWKGIVENNSVLCEKIKSIVVTREGRDERREDTISWLPAPLDEHRNKLRTLTSADGKYLAMLEVFVEDIEHVVPSNRFLAHFVDIDSDLLILYYLEDFREKMARTYLKWDEIRGLKIYDLPNVELNTA